MRVGSGRASTQAQNLDAQRDALTAAGCFDTRLILRLGFDHPVRQALARPIQVTEAAGQFAVGLITYVGLPPANRMGRPAKERLEMHSARERLLVAATAGMRDA